MKKLGLCLSGGGARGAYQVGALEALEEVGLLKQFEAFSGTSIGSANLAVLLSSSLSRVRALWLDMPEHGFADKDEMVAHWKEHKFRFLENGLFSIQALDKLLDAAIDIDAIRKHDFFVTVAKVGDASDGVLQFIKATFQHYFHKDDNVLYLNIKDQGEDDIKQAVIASCSIPVVFPVQQIKDSKYVDGGLFDNVPVKPLVDAGCTDVVVIDITRFIRTGAHEMSFKGVHVHTLRPSKSIGRVLDFTPKHAATIHQQGYDDMKAFLASDLSELSS